MVLSCTGRGATPVGHVEHSSRKGRKKQTKIVTPFNSWTMPTRGLGDTLTNCCGPVVYREGGHPRSPSYFSFTARRGARETSQSRALRDDSPVILVSQPVVALAKRVNPGRCTTTPQLCARRARSLRGGKTLRNKRKGLSAEEKHGETNLAELPET